MENNTGKTILEYVGKLARVLGITKSRALYDILTGELPACSEQMHPRYKHSIWLHHAVTEQLKEIAHREHISVNRLISDTVAGKHAALTLTPPPVRKAKKHKHTVTMSVYKPIVAWITAVARELNIHTRDVVARCLQDKTSIAQAHAWPALSECKQYSTIAVSPDTAEIVRKARVPGQSLSYTLYKLMEATQKSEQQQPKAAEAAETAPLAVADKAEKEPVQKLAQDPAIMLADLRARCRELLVELMEQEFARIRKTVLSI